MATALTGSFLVFATFLLISPPDAATYPGAIPWSSWSLLRLVTDAMSLFGWFPTARGVEIKDVVLQVSVCAALALLGIRAVVSGLLPPAQRSTTGAWLSGQVLLLAWVLITALSAMWSGDISVSLGQAATIAFPVAWAVAVCWTLESRDAPRLIWAYVLAATLGSAMCIWYYFGRNPFHRPGFPIGNPSSLAAALLPAVLISFSVLVGSINGLIRGRTDVSRAALLTSTACLPWLLGCLWLAESRGAVVGGILGLAGLAFLVVTRRARVMIIVTLAVLASLGVWRLSSSMQDVTMARGATIRFRLYTWRYAADLWNRRPVTGMGAGCFPRAAGTLAAHDRVLDPAAFMGDKIAHAHNEFFEVFAEIGLIGGLTLIGGLVATLAAAGGLLQSRFSRQRYLLMLGLVSGVIAILGDCLFGVNMRLPGVPAVFFTLLGVLWAMCRSMSKGRVAGTPEPKPRSSAQRYGFAGVAAVCCTAAIGLAARNTTGLRQEVSAMAALQQRRFEDCLRDSESAAERLLDPIRKLLSIERQVVTRALMAADAFAAAEPIATAPEPVKFDAMKAARESYEAAGEFHALAPGFGYAAAISGQACEYLAELLATSSPGDAARWKRTAWISWHLQRQFTPYDRTTLLAMARHPMPPAEQLGLLRDALRNGDPDGRWVDALRQISRHPAFESTLDALVQAAEPYTPQSDAGALILRAAPEVFRLRGIWLRMSGQPALAARDAARAAGLYRPLRSRLPTLTSVALSEQAKSLFEAFPFQPQQAIDLEREAIELLPRIQDQKYFDMAGPFRARLARYLIAAGEMAQARALLDVLFENDQPARNTFIEDAYRAIITAFAAQPDERRAAMAVWVDELLQLSPKDPLGWDWRCWLAAERGEPQARQAYQAARSAGLDPETLARIRDELCAGFPTLCDLPSD